MDVSEVDGAADGSLVGEALGLVRDLLEDLMVATGADPDEHADVLQRLDELVALIG